MAHSNWFIMKNIFAKKMLCKERNFINQALEEKLRMLY